MVIRARAVVAEAAGSLSASMQRSVLALLGIVIGIASVIAMISVGTIVKDEAARQFRELGTDILTVKNLSRPTPRGAAATIALADAVGLASLPAIAASAPYIVSRGQAIIAGKAAARATVVGVTAVYSDVAGVRLGEGRFISDLDHRRHYCVIGVDIAAAMRAAGAGPLLGKPLRIDDVVYTVVGVLRSARRISREFPAGRAVIVPITTAQRVSGISGVRSITARMSPNVHYLAAMAEVHAYFRRKSRDLAVRVDSPEKLIEGMTRQMRLFTLLLGTVGGISLLVGGIGVMNVMLSSVTERRLEIGIRRALGARRRDIQWQFLIESLILALLGGIFGTALGAGAVWTICQFTGWTFMVPAFAVALGAGVACAVGVFFGFYPARAAARLDPITALRGK